jgi:hypothetical protein
MDNWFNIGLGALQIVILIFQCFVAAKEYVKSKREKKGLLQISYTNISSKMYEHSNLDWEYDLNSLMSFKNVGDDFIRVSMTEIIIDGNKKYNNTVPNGISLSNTSDFSTYKIDFQLNERESKKEEIEVTLIVHMENSMDYKYRQEIVMGFKKGEQNRCWQMYKYDWKIRRGR